MHAGFILIPYLVCISYASVAARLADASMLGHSEFQIVQQLSLPGACCGLAWYRLHGV